MIDEELSPAANTLFDKIAEATNAVPQAEAENVLLYMAAIVAVKRRAGLPAAGIKAELSGLLGKAVDSLMAEPDSP